MLAFSPPPHLILPKTPLALSLSLSNLLSPTRVLTDSLITGRKIVNEAVDFQINTNLAYGSHLDILLVFNAFYFLIIS